MRLTSLFRLALATLIVAGLATASFGGILGCGSDGSSGGTGGGSGGTAGGEGALILFTGVGESLPAFDLIDLEFLPGRGGEAIVIGKDGTIYYMRDDFTFLSDHPSVAVLDSGEQGLLNIEADPGYDSNRFIYLFFTLPDGSGNRVQRFTVSADTVADGFSIAAGPVVATALKSDSPDPGENHNGGGLAFDAAGNLYIGFGDGGGGASFLGNSENAAQNPGTFLGKIVRVATQPALGAPSVYARGLRNPFTLTEGNGGIFIGDVGGDNFEEINFADAAGLNFGWAETEGPTSEPGFRSPLHGFAHSDETFINEDPASHPALRVDRTKSHNGVDHGDVDKSILVGSFYTGSRYDGLLADRLVYADFYAGWVRSFRLSGGEVEDDQHMGHLEGMTSLQQGPDGFLYAVSLFGSQQILRVDLGE